MKQAALSILEKAGAEHRESLVETEALSLCRLYGIEGPRHNLARSEDEAARVAKEIGYPVVAKILSPDILHKSDVGGVRVSLGDEASLRRAFREITSSVAKSVPDAEVWGIVVEEMLPAGIESIVGMKKDSQFGPAIMFGLGGVLVELLRDVTFRITPVSTVDAEEMIREIKGFPLLDGYRGSVAADKASLASCIVSVSRMASDLPQIEQIDLNPVIVYPKGAKVADARVILTP